MIRVSRVFAPIEPQDAVIVFKEFEFAHSSGKLCICVFKVGLIELNPDAAALCSWVAASVRNTSPKDDGILSITQLLGPGIPFHKPGHYTASTEAVIT